MCGLVGAIAFHFTPAWVFWIALVITALLWGFLGFWELADWRRERGAELRPPGMGGGGDQPGRYED